MNDDLNRVIEDLTLSQLRELILVTAGVGRVGGLASQNRKELLRQLEVFADKQFLSLAAHKIEAISPHKHVIPYAIEGHWTLLALSNKIKDAYSNILNKLETSLELSIDQIQAELAIVDEPNGRAYIKFNHLVEAFRWELVSKDEKIRRRFRRRHPVTVVFREKLQLVSIEFMGFSQISLGDQPISYRDIAKDVAANITDTLKLILEPVSVRAKVAELLSDPNSKVTDAKLSLPGPVGRMTFSSAADEMSVVQVLVRQFRAQGLNLSIRDARQVLNSEDADDIVLFWQAHGILTRISFEEKGSELLFIWRGTESSTALVDAVLAALTAAYDQKLTSTVSRVSDLLGEIPRGSYVGPAYLARRLSITLPEALGMLLKAKEAGEFDFAFRIRGEVANDLENSWRRSQNELPRLANKQGELLEPTDPKNVEVGFRRLGAH